MNDLESQASPASGPPVLTVSALNQAVSKLLERNFPLSWVAGEISNFTRAASGHWYFTLKDAQAQVRSVMFKSRAQYADFMPREGDKVEVRALVTLYAPRGEYQLSVESIRRAGLGNLYEAFLRLKQALAAEGLFDPARKRPLPAFVRTIGIVTSTQAAALRDVLTALRRRAPHVAVVIYPTPVQGDGAAIRIADAIRTASARAECDVLLVCRGGGSIEDLWSFNEEIVARAIASCSMPVISGVGHETDFTIADFTADLRAPTPTAAAELATRPRSEWQQAIEAGARELANAMRRRLRDQVQTLDWLTRRLQSPAAAVGHERVKLRALEVRLQHAVRAPLSRSRFALLQLLGRLGACLPDVAARRRDIGESARRLSSCMESQQGLRRQHLAALAAQLELLNPQRTLERGYAIVTDRKGHIVRTPAALKPRQFLQLRLAEGSAEISIATVQQTLE
ncbi:exodeoxyribonuclease VII large subunit [Lacisediminimonas profundi]|uniref:exodeoxyribonuclease VII large subunit n=1 Tax=Lacisediminimonas profundi TaxID=2603856 RepID=UPI00124AEA14|nr:exodeoxyribonuclease VII large subunit [Lacisediminimonas profundi]